MFRSGTGNGILGRDFSGVVLDVGRKVTNVDVGDSVWSALPIAGKKLKNSSHPKMKINKIFKNL